LLYLIFAGSIALFFGAVMLFTPGFLRGLSRFFDRLIIRLDRSLRSYSTSAGIVLFMIAAWFFYMSCRYPEGRTFLTPVWILCLIFAVLYLFFPPWLDWLTEVSDRNIFPTDEYVMGACRIAGIILMLTSVYIFFGAYILARKY
jgi:hypothetical protein